MQCSMLIRLARRLPAFLLAGVVLFPNPASAQNAAPPAAEAPKTEVPKTDAPRSETEKPSDGSKPGVADRAELERRFEESMRDVAFDGYFTASDQPEGKLSKDRYVIEKVVKEKDNLWTFHARIQYGKHDMPVRLKIPVVWAGDTPVISVTKLSIPLLGTFNARIVIHEGHYAGTWSGAGHGGQMFGRIVKNDGQKSGEKKPEKDAPNGAAEGTK